jgi:GT2 family glycosyltransferase
MTSTQIPKIIHQLWIGNKAPPPKNLMDTWRDKNPDFTYIYWNEEEFAKRKIVFKCQKRIDEIEEINGKADIIRWELLYHYGGVFLDADSICIEPIDDELMNKKSFAGWENETARPGLIATGTMGFPPKHPLPAAAVELIIKNPVSQKKTNRMAWQNVGPGLLTALYNTGKYKDLNIFPSYTFLPIHLTNLEYKGHGKIYAYQAWGSTKQSYGIMNSLSLPEQFLKPPLENSVSILVSSYNTKFKYIQECLQSIKHQIGLFNIQLVWINDGSSELNTKLLKTALDSFSRTSRFIEVLYHENEKNMGIGYTLNKGIQLCSHELIIKMDSDDIMINDRILKQVTYMNENPDVMICGTQINCFKDDPDNVVNITRHPCLTWNQYKNNPSHWFVNHPTLCYRKKAVLDVGNYDINKSRMTEDFELALRMLKKYGYVHNFEEPLLNYRLHDSQVTHNGGEEGRAHWHGIRVKLIEELISNS